MITLALVQNVDTDGVYVVMPGSRGLLRGPYRALSTVAAGTTVLVASTDDGEQVVVGPADGEKGVLGVKAFGAKGDGVTDDTDAIVAAFAACASGGTVLFPPGDYLSDLLTVSTEAVCIAGYGATLRPIPTVAPNLAMIAVTGDRVIIEGLTIDGDSTGMFGIKIGEMDGSAVGVTVKDVTVTGTVMHGIWAEGAADLTVDRVTMQSCGLASSVHGAGLFASACANLTVRGCLARDAYEHGYYILGDTETGALVSGCHAIDNGVRSTGGTGFSIRQSGTTVSGCYASGNYLAALNVSWPIQYPSLLSGSDVVVSGCVLGWSVSADREMMIVGMDNVSLIGNVVVSTSSASTVRLGEATTGTGTNGLMSGNHVMQLNASGTNAVLVQSNGWTVSGNKITGDAVGNGVTVGTTVTGGLDILGNRIRDFEQGIYLLSGASDYVTILGNTISDCSTTSIQDASTGTNNRVLDFDARPNVTGSRGGNAALASLLTALDGLGLITDSSS